MKTKSIGLLLFCFGVSFCLFASDGGGGMSVGSRSVAIHTHLLNTIVWHWGNTNTSMYRKLPISRAMSRGPANSSLAVGSTFTALLAPDKTVWTWGQNNVGQLGIGTTCDCEVKKPVRVLLDTDYGPFPNPDPNYHMPVPQLSDIVEISAGVEHAIALRSWGDVFFWGSSGFYPFTHTFARVPNGADPVDIKHIAAGGFHDLLLSSNGVVHAWGDNRYGQVGNGTTYNVDAPGASVLTDIAAIAAGDYHSVALDRFGRVWVWGRNNSGQLCGIAGSYVAQPTLTNLRNVAAIAAGGSYTMILFTDGRITWFGEWPTTQRNFGANSLQVMQE